MMIKHKYIEHLADLESIRNDSTMSPRVRELVDDLQKILTAELYNLVNNRSIDEKN